MKKVFQGIINLIVALIKKFFSLLVFTIQHPIYVVVRLFIWLAVISIILMLLAEKLELWGWDKYIDAFFYKLFPWLF